MTNEKGISWDRIRDEINVNIEFSVDIAEKYFGNKGMEENEKDKELKQRLKKFEIVTFRVVLEYLLENDPNLNDIIKEVEK